MSTTERVALETLLDADMDEWERQFNLLGSETGFNLMMAALIEACFIQFPQDPSREEIAAYVDHLKTVVFPPESEIKTVQTEAAIRASFGDSAALAGIPAVEVVAAQVAVVFAVRQEHGLVGAAREKFISEVLDALD